MKKKILDLGCGLHKKTNAIGFDCIKLNGVDIVGNLNQNLPFQDNEFDIVYLDNVLEHVENLEHTLSEVHRITKSTGKILIQVPYYNAPSGMNDPSHKHYFTEKTLDYFVSSFGLSYYYPFHFKLLNKIIHPNGIGRFIPKRLLTKISKYIGNLINAISVVFQPIK